jgi:hypothetical protein
MPTKAKIKKKPKRNTWVYIYGDEMLEIWEHEADDNPERLFTHNGEEFYITSIEESEDEL